MGKNKALLSLPGNQAVTFIEYLVFLLSQPLSTDTLLVPLVHNIPQVLLAIYPRSILPLVREQLLQGRHDLRCLLKVAPVQFVEEAQLRQSDPQLRSFMNINTPEELRQILQTGPSSLGH